MPLVTTTHQRRWYQGPMLAVVGIGAIALLVGLVLLLGWWLKDTTGETAGVIQTAGTKQFKGDYDGAVRLLKPQIPKAKTNNEKAQLYMAIGSSYSSKGDNKAALDAFKQAYALDKSYGVASAIAQTAEAMGDKAQALDYYQRALKALKADKNVQQTDEQERVQNKIKELGGN